MTIVRERLAIRKSWRQEQLGRVSMPDGEVVEDEAREQTHVSGRPFLLAAFAKVRAMYDAGETVAAITPKLHLTRRIVDKWVCLESLP
jgi:hypothetical protein